MSIPLSWSNGRTLEDSGVVKLGSSRGESQMEEGTLKWAGLRWSVLVAVAVIGGCEVERR